MNILIQNKFPLTAYEMVLTLSKNTSDFRIPNTEAKYFTSSAFASPSTGGADMATLTNSSEISANKLIFPCTNRK